ncbi:MAG: hypothetical protein ACI80P_000575 [Flavobacteriales bacterium]
MELTLKKRMYKARTIFFFFCLSFQGMAQCDVPEFPKEAKFETNTDYRSKDGMVKTYLDWLVITPLSTCVSEREQLNAFVLVWLSGHPDIRVDVKSDALPFFRAHPDLLFPMLHGMAIYEMVTPLQEKNQVDAHVAGIETVLDVVDSKKMSKTSSFKALKKLRRKGRLNEFVSSKI